MEAPALRESFCGKCETLAVCRCRSGISWCQQRWACSRPTSCWCMRAPPSAASTPGETCAPPVPPASSILFHPRPHAATSCLLPQINPLQHELQHHCLLVEAVSSDVLSTAHDLVLMIAWGDTHAICHRMQMYKRPMCCILKSDHVQVWAKEHPAAAAVPAGGAAAHIRASAVVACHAADAAERRAAGGGGRRERRRHGDPSGC